MSQRGIVYSFLVAWIVGTIISTYVSMTVFVPFLNAETTVWEVLLICALTLFIIMATTVYLNVKEARK